MFNIINKTTLRDAYMFLRLYQAHSTCYDQVTKMQTVIEIKRDIRAYHKKQKANDRWIVRDEGIDGYICLIELPGYLKNQKDAVSYFRKHEFMDEPHSPYDCTGKSFTAWFKVFKRRDKFFAYHRVAIDC